MLPSVLPALEQSDPEGCASCKVRLRLPIVVAGEDCQSVLPPNMPLWHVDYFDLKALKTRRRKKGTLTFPFLPESKR